MTPDLPTAALTVRVHKERPFFEAMWRQDGLLVKRRIGPAWLMRNPSTGKWDLPRRGRVAPGYYDEARAHVAAARSSARTRRRQPNMSASVRSDANAA